MKIFILNGTKLVGSYTFICHQILMSLFKYFGLSSLFCNTCYSLYYDICSIMITVAMARAMGHDFSDH